MNSEFSTALFNSFTKPAVITDLDGNIIKVNRGFETEFQLNTDNICGRPLDEFIELSCRLNDVSADGGFIRYVYRPTREEGQRGRVQVSRLRLESGDADGFVVFFQRRSGLDEEELYSALNFAVRVLPYPFMLWDHNAHLFCFNEAARKYYEPIGDIFQIGNERERILRAGVEKGVFGSLDDTFKVTLDEIIKLQEQPEKGPLVSVAKEKSGQWRRSVAYFSPEGWGASYLEDITDLKKVELELEKRTEMYELILESVPDFVLLTDTGLNVVYASLSYARAMGRDSSSLAGRPSDLLGEMAKSEVLASRIKSPTEDDSSFFYDQQLKEASGHELLIRWRTRALFDGGKHTGFITVGRDITREHRQESSLRQQSSELRKKNESLEQFAAVVSHDLKAPLRHLAVFAEMIIEETAGGNYEELPLYADHVRKAAIRMNGVVKKLLEYSQIAYKIVSPARTSLNDIVIQAVQNLEGEIERTHAELLVSNLPEIYGDPDLLRHLMQNLIANAVKYTRPGTRPRVRVYSSYASDTLDVIVEDNGIGIEDKYAETVFSAFQRLHKDDSVYDGFGIGLALCKQVVESHGGRIKLDTEYVGGARFIVQFPLSSVVR